MTEQLLTPAELVNRQRAAKARAARRAKSPKRVAQDPRLDGITFQTRQEEAQALRYMAAHGQAAATETYRSAFSCKNPDHGFDGYWERRLSSTLCVQCFPTKAWLALHPDAAYVARQASPRDVPTPDPEPEALDPVSPEDFFCPQTLLT